MQIVKTQISLHIYLCLYICLCPIYETVDINGLNVMTENIGSCELILFHGPHFDFDLKRQRFTCI